MQSFITLFCCTSFKPSWLGWCLQSSESTDPCMPLTNESCTTWQSLKHSCRDLSSGPYLMMTFLTNSFLNESTSSLVWATSITYIFRWWLSKMFRFRVWRHHFLYLNQISFCANLWCQSLCLAVWHRMIISNQLVPVTHVSRCQLIKQCSLYWCLCYTCQELGIRFVPHCHPMLWGCFFNMPFQGQHDLVVGCLACVHSMG